MTTGEFAWLAPCVKPVMSGLAPLAKQKLVQNQLIIKLRERMKLRPEHLPSNFQGVYAYAIADFTAACLPRLGLEKMRMVLELVALEEMVRALRSAYQADDFTVLSAAGDVACHDLEIGDRIKFHQIDATAELERFYQVFCDVVVETKLPKEIALSNQIADVERKVEGGFAAVESRIEDGFSRIEQRLSATAEERSPQHQRLADQMRGWFEALHYEFERHEVWAEDYFEWVIRITQPDPIRRRDKTYRIVVRGDAGEVTLKNLAGLRKAVGENRADGRWLIANRRVSAAVQQALDDDDENANLKCCTFNAHQRTKLSNIFPIGSLCLASRQSEPDTQLQAAHSLVVETAHQR